MLRLELAARVFLARTYQPVIGKEEVSVMLGIRSVLDSAGACRACTKSNLTISGRQERMGGATTAWTASQEDLFATVSTDSLGQRQAVITLTEGSVILIVYRAVGEKHSPIVLAILPCTLGCS